MNRFMLVLFVISGLLIAEDMSISFAGVKFDPLKDGEPQLKSSLMINEKAGENYYLVQFDGPIMPEWKEELQKIGAKIYQYVPHFAFVVRMNSDMKAKAKGLKHVRWIGLYQPAYKIHPDVYKKSNDEPVNVLPRIILRVKGKKIIAERKEYPVWEDPLYVENDPWLYLSIRLFPGSDIGKVVTALLDIGADVQKVYNPGDRIVLRISPEFLDSIARIPEVNTIVRQARRTFHSSVWRYGVQTDTFTVAYDQDLGEDWDTVTAGVTLADKGIDGDGEIVTIHDTGLDYWSGFFQDPQNDPPGSNHISVVDYTDEGSGETQEIDPCTHGSNVSTIVAGDCSIADNHPNGGNMMVYYDWGGQTRGNTVDYFPTKLYIQDVAHVNGSGQNASCLFDGATNFSTSLSRAYTRGSRIHQNSWGYSGSGGNYQYEAIDVDVFTWNNRDMVVNFSAGNDGPSTNTVGPPSTSKNCISVAAAWLPTYDVPYDSICWFSSRGWTDDNRIKPEVAAPGGADTTYNNNTADYREFIWGAGANSSWAGDSAHGYLSGMMGTSQACPQVSGATALVRQYFTDGFYPGGYAGSGASVNPPGYLVKAVLITSTVDMGVKSAKGTPVPNQAEGWGKVVLDQALYFNGEGRKLFLAYNTTGLNTGQTFDTSFVVTDGSQELKIVLCWYDTAAASGADPTLVNDLDLTVTDPNGNTYRGNVFSGGYSTTGGSADRRNTVEVVWLPASKAPTGTYNLSVYAYNVPNGPVPFAVSVAGGVTPLAIYTTNMSCVPEVEGVRVVWNLNTFPRIVGFNVLRSEVEGSKGEKVNDRILPASGSGTYSYVDRTVEPGKTYYYTVELIKDTGKRYYYGPVKTVSGGLIEEGFVGIDPNPFRDRTGIHFAVREKADVSLKIYDITGRNVATLINGKMRPGYYSMLWEGGKPSGTYFAVLKINDNVYKEKLIKVRR